MKRDAPQPHEIARADTVAEVSIETPVTSTSAAPTSALARGAQLGRYVVLDLVGSGGMGIVYSAYDSNLDRKVAIKLLRELDDRADRDYDARLLREAQAMAKLSHPNVVTVFEAGKIDGNVFIAMEYVDGDTLKGWLAREPRTWRQILDVMLQAGAGLNAAHQAGIIHRDFKPDNIVIGKDGRVLVMDFGLARKAREAEAPAARRQRTEAQVNLNDVVTRSGLILGTPAYMAPEQFQREAATARSDQFSFCVTLWETLYGERPFGGTNVAEVAENVLNGRLQQPEAPIGPRAIRNVAMRGLRSVPEERYGSMAELLVALGKVRAPASRPWYLAGVVVAIAGLLVGFLAWRRDGAAQAQRCTGSEERIGQIWNPERASALKVAFQKAKRVNLRGAYPSIEKGLDAFATDWSQMHHEACLATRVRGEQSESMLDQRMLCLERRRNELEALTQVLVKGDERALIEASKAVRNLSPIADCANLELLTIAVQPPADERMRTQVEEVRRSLAKAKELGNIGSYEEALRVGRAALALAEQSTYRPAEAEALLLVGSLEWQSGAPEQSEKTLVRSVEVAEASKYALEKTKAMIELTNVVGFELARPTDGLLWGRLATASLEAIGNDPLLRARLLSYVGNATWRTHDLKKTLALQQEALAIRVKALGEDHPDVAESHNNLSTVYLGLGDFDRALENEQKALEIRKRVLTDGHPLVAESHNNLGNIYFEDARYDEALAEYRIALAMWQDTLGEAHPNVAIAVTNVANVLAVTDKFDEALADYQRALHIEERALGKAHPEVASSLQNIGLLYLRHEDPATALTYLGQAVEVWKTAYGESNQETLEGQVSLAEALKAHGDVAKARDLLEQVVATSATAKVEPGFTAHTQFELADLLWASPAARSRALTLAHRARDDLAHLGEPTTGVDEWLAQRPR